MARTIKQIGDYIRGLIAGDPVIAPVAADTSLVADWRLWTDKVADSQHDTEVLYDAHKAEVQGIIATEKLHTLQWYATIAKAFQYGDSLPADTDVYAVIDATKQIVAFAAALELVGLVRIKVAKIVGGVLAKLSGGELTAFTTYMGRVKDAGVRLQCTSGDPDNLQLALNIYYDPLILDATGARIDGSAATPVLDGCNGYIDNLPFNGIFSYNDFVDSLQAVEGVKIAEPLVCQANYAMTAYVDIKAATPNIYTPDAGYLKIDVGYFTVNYIAH